MKMTKIIGSLMVAGMILSSSASVLTVSAAVKNDVRTESSIKSGEVADHIDHFTVNTKDWQLSLMPITRVTTQSETLPLT
ncbi:hypothetical protein OXT66_02090 [Lentilactobacillus senioris]|uniref:hypothetical protein n=1 Tax=Lentilactobacillus senioris TaxID=931534 RepID=UPI00228057DC|nr:hypothetical protein [Lentilactobacillus senioris]MCY9806337.1 hypothetical protein [Lentilactobacillus senioris]